MQSRLTPHTILQRLPTVQVQIDSSNQVRVLLAGQSLRCGPQALAVLEAFAHPTALAEALTTFQARGVQQWMDVTSTIVTLYQAGVLRDLAPGRTPPHPTQRGSVMLSGRTWRISFSVRGLTADTGTMTTVMVSPMALNTSRA